VQKQDPPGARPRAGVVNLERRKYPRFNVDLPIEYERTTSVEPNPGRARNASQGGLLVYLPEKMQIGQRLKLKLFFTIGSNLNTVEALTEVAWADFHVGNNWGDYRSGLRFVDISQADLEKFESFLISLAGFDSRKPQGGER
jgi:c-di-GMP-binding flagellar brake protein YcgR